MTIKNNAIFDSLALKIGFKCALGTTYNMSTGNYGVILELYSSMSEDAENPQTQCTRVFFDTTEFIGNPYYFITYFNQEKKIDISTLGNIEHINLILV